MKILRKVLAVSAAAVVALASGVLVAQADSTPTVYNTPGGQISNGRLWDTTCEKYSSNVVRCRANIWATQVQYRGGRYVSVTGWTFNNLSYLPSTRASWEGNNLGQKNDRWNSGGRTWRTECDTATTGRGGCRSYVWTKQARIQGGKVVVKSDWVFNNLVLFSTRTVPEVTTVPAWIIDQSRLDFTGLTGTPIQVGASMPDLNKLGYFKYVPGPGYWDSSQSLRNRGIFAYKYQADKNLRGVEINKKGIRTVDGAQVGMTLGEIKAIYGDRLHLETKESHHDIYTAVVNSGNNELVFVIGDRPLKDSDVVGTIMARIKSPEIF